MAKKSIIDIDVNDEKFKEFLNIFKEYQENLDDMPEAWKKLSDAMGGAGGVFNKSATATMGVIEHSAEKIGKMAEALHRATKAQEQFYRATTVSDSGMTRLVKSSEHLGKSLFGIGTALFKIATIGAIGGAFGMFGLGESAYRRQRESRGLGLSTGQIASFKTHMAPFVDPADVLNRAANAKNDITKWWALSAMGIPVEKARRENAEQLSFDLINHARSIWRNGPQTLQYAQARGLTEMGFSLDDLRRLSNTPGLHKAEAATLKDSGVLGFSNKVGDEYTKMVVTLQKARVQIETTLIDGLAPLAKPLAAMAQTLTADFVRFMNAPGTKKAIGNAGNEIRDFFGFLGSKDLRNDLVQFGEAIKDVTGLILWATKKYESLKPDFNIKDWIEAGKDLLFPFKTDWYSPAKPMSQEEKLRSLVPDHFRPSTGDVGAQTQGEIHKLIGQANRGRGTALANINIKVTTPAGFGVERQANGAGH